MKRPRFLLLLIIAALLAAGALPALAQGGPDDAPLPLTAEMTGFRHEYQGWNNCGPATLATVLSYFGWTGDQYTAAAWLKPDSEDKNVSPWQLVQYTQEQTAVRALVRYGTTLDSIRRLIASGFPVIIAAGYEPDGYDWMGHYLLVAGYDRREGTFLTQDSFLGPDYTYTEAEIDTYWRHFNRVYIVFYEEAREADLLALLGEDAAEEENLQRALAVAAAEARADEAGIDPYAWFNIGTNLTLLGEYDSAVTAFERARAIGLPWRMLWYQFGPLEAHYMAGDYAAVLELVQFNLATTPPNEHAVEETYYYAGLARLGLGETDRATLNLQQALLINPNFTPAREALDTLP